MYKYLDIVYSLLLVYILTRQVEKDRRPENGKQKETTYFKHCCSPHNT